MIVHFDGKSEQYHPATGLTLKPGDNEVSEDQGAALVAAKVVKKQTAKSGKEK